ncbi:MAG: HU family DNA-binding protein [Paramuribaculum sp.]|nr:HU family DNA-binding protein [Paramuribaculum sp.]
MNTKVSFHQIAQNVATRADISVEAAERFIKTLFETASFALENSEGVTIHSLGTFRKSDDPANPVAFVPDEYLAKAVNSPFEMFLPAGGGRRGGANS